jgi:cob(I)alamin adenosyltransferase
MAKGLFVLFSADDQENLTAAMGQVFRALGRGMKVCVIQLGKGHWNSGPETLWDRFADQLECHVVGNTFAGQQEDREPEIQAGEAWRLAKDAINSGRFSMVVLENFTGLLSDHIIQAEEMVRFLAERPENVDIVMTGGKAPLPVIEAADLVTEVVAHRRD